MKFESRFAFQEWLGELLHKELGDKVEDVSGESNEATGRCDLIVVFKNGDEATLSIKMEDSNFSQK